MDVNRAIPGRVAGSGVSPNKDGKHDVRMIQVVVTSAKDIRWVELFSQPGEKVNPIDGTRVAIINLGTSWPVAVAADDGVDPSEVSRGERKNYSTNPGGTIVTSIHFKNDGTLEITADTAVTITAPTVTINGDLVVTGTITGETDVIAGAGSISGASHTHPISSPGVTEPPT